jgi:hypothetical protein
MRTPIDALHAANAALADVDLGALADVEDGALDEVVHALAALRTNVEACWLRVIALADARALHHTHHRRDASTWLAELSGERVGTARRDVELATALAEAGVVAEAAMEAGLSKAKTAELLRAERLPEALVRELAVGASEQSVEQVAAAVRRARLEHRDEDAPVEPSCELTRSHDRVRIAATVDLVGGELLEVALDAISEAADVPRDVPYAQRRAHGLVALARYYLDHAAHPPLGRVGRPHVLVTVDLEVLEARVGGSAILASGAVITGDQARQLADDAKVTRVLMRGPSQVLDLGRTTRTIPPHLAKAVIARDRHCRYEGCAAPPWACEVHHRVPWARGGRTDLANLGLLCWHHHQRVHRIGPDRLRTTHDGRWRLDAPAPWEGVAARAS